MSKNTIKTYVLLAALGGLLIIGGQLLWGGTGAIIGLAIDLVLVGGSYRFSDKIAIAAARAKPVSEQETPELYAIVRELTAAARMPMPRLYITPELRSRASSRRTRPQRSGSPAYVTGARKPDPFPFLEKLSVPSLLNKRELLIRFRLALSLFCIDA